MDVVLLFTTCTVWIVLQYLHICVLYVSVTQGGHGGLSAYELERLENIRQNQAFLSSINLFQVGRCVE